MPEPTTHPSIAGSQLRRTALLAVAVVSAAVAVALPFATDDDDTRDVADTPAPALTSNAIDTANGVRYDGGPDEGTRAVTLANTTPELRYDGGPEEGSRGVTFAATTPEPRYDGGPEEGSRGAGR